MLYLSGNAKAKSKDGHNVNGYYPVINYELCYQCSQECSCSHGAFRHYYDTADGRMNAVIMPNKCTGCEECLKICGQGAIKILKIGSYQEAENNEQEIKRSIKI